MWVVSALPQLVLASFSFQRRGYGISTTRLSPIPASRTYANLTRNVGFVILIILVFPIHSSFLVNAVHLTYKPI